MGGCCSCCSSDGDGEPAVVQMAPYNIEMDAELRGPDVRVTTLRVTGAGAALCAASLEQDATYWEVRVDAPGTYAVGVARAEGCDLAAALGQGSDSSFGLQSTADGLAFAAGTIIGVAFTQNDFPNLRFFADGKELGPEHSVNKIRGMVRPAVSVADGAALTLNFGAQPFQHSPPRGFDRLMIPRDMLGGS